MTTSALILFGSLGFILHLTGNVPHFTWTQGARDGGTDRPRDRGIDGPRGPTDPGTHVLTNPGAKVPRHPQGPVPTLWPSSGDSQWTVLVRFHLGGLQVKDLGSEPIRIYQVDRSESDRGSFGPEPLSCFL